MFEYLMRIYKSKLCTADQLQRYVALGKITQIECDFIIEEGDNAKQR